MRLSLYDLTVAEPSKLWKEIRDALLSEAMPLDNFRAPGGLNSRLASWEPSEKSLRWYKSFLLLAVNTSPKSHLEIYSHLESTSLGNPIEVNDRDGVPYNLDYLLTCQEIFFLKSKLTGSVVIENVCEIGAGFGRTCHGVLMNFPEVMDYTIIDLPEMLELQSRYLSEVLTPELYNKIRFQSFDSYDKRSYDLVIQIDAFQEMDAAVIDAYFHSLIDFASNVFIKNPLGKYNPESAGLNLPFGTYIPLDLGRSRAMLDIWHMDEVSSQIDSHNANYLPASHRLAHWELDRLFPHFVLQLYVQDSPRKN